MNVTVKRYERTKTEKVLGRTALVLGLVNIVVAYRNNRALAKSILEERVALREERQERRDKIAAAVAEFQAGVRTGRSAKPTPDRGGR